jgi:hypothetical protein
MVHGPCGIAHYSPCLNDKKECSKGFPKPFQDETVISGVLYVKTRRRDTGVSVLVQNTAINNRSVILYSPYLLQCYQAHINVECTTGFNTIKYIYKVSSSSGASYNSFSSQNPHSIFIKVPTEPPFPSPRIQMEPCRHATRCNYILTPNMLVLSRLMHVPWAG